MEEEQLTIEEAVNALKRAIAAEMREDYYAEALSKIFGGFTGSWTPAKIKPAFDSLSEFFGNEEDAGLLILYMVGWMMAVGKIRLFKVSPCGKNKEIHVSEGEDGADGGLFEENTIRVGDIKMELIVDER